MFVLQFLPYIMSVGEKIVSLYESNRKPVTCLSHQNCGTKVMILEEFIMQFIGVVDQIQLLLFFFLCVAKMYF